MSCSSSLPRRSEQSIPERILRDTPLGKGDFWGLDDFKVVGKSFINGFGSKGYLGWRAGLGVYNLPYSVDPAYADIRLGVFEQLVGRLAAFNQNPMDDSKDGLYRLFAQTTVHLNCDGDQVVSASMDAVDMQGGEEFPGIFGTINALANLTVTASSAVLKLRTWGHPNALVEPGMQWVALRTSRNIWHEATVQFSCKCGKRLLGFSGSRYPSRKLWVNGNLETAVVQGPISSLWNADPNNLLFVAP
jgi:hypothetical protein